jgi:hypothetical protein
VILRALTVLAILAALTGAPSSVLGTTGELSDAQASPTAGTTETTFSVAVRYDGRFPALAVTALVAERTVNLKLTSGTATSGTWSGTVSGLLLGSWPVVFTALPELGNDLTLAGLPLTVTAGATPLPTIGSLDPSAPDSRNPGDGSDGTTVPEPDPTQDTVSPTSPDEAVDPPNTTPTAPTAPTAPAEAVMPVGNESTGPASGPPPDAATRPSPETSAPIHDGAETARRPDAGTVAGPGRGAGADTRAADAGSGQTPAATSADDTLNTVLFVGLSGVAAVAIIGAALLAAGRWRRRPPEEPGPVRAATTQRDEVDQLLMRRTLRRGRSRLAEDPIVAALGIDRSSDERRRVRRRAEQVGRGPGERPRPERPGR